MWSPGFWTKKVNRKTVDPLQIEIDLMTYATSLDFKFSLCICAVWSVHYENTPIQIHVYRKFYHQKKKIFR